MKKYLYMLLVLLGMMTVVSCSESDENDTEFDNWKSRNSEYFENLYQLVSQKVKDGDTECKMLRSFSKETSSEGAHTDYIIVKKISEGTSTESPQFLDSVRVHYRGYLIPSASHTKSVYGQSVGKQFDTSWFGEVLNTSISKPAKFKVSGVVDGFATALMHMHVGDHWLVTIPYQLGYGSLEASSVPSYSVLVFDIQLHSFARYGTPLPNLQ